MACNQLTIQPNKASHINIKPTSDPKLAELEARAAQGTILALRFSYNLHLGCPHAKQLLEKLKSGAELKEEEKDCGCGSADRKNAEAEKDESKESELPKPDETYPDKRYNQEILISKGFYTQFLKEVSP